MEKIKVLMIGPDRSVHGGISGVVNNYYEAGIEEKIQLTYIGTMVEGSKLRKLLQAVSAYLQFCRALKDNTIVHIHMASDSSYYRKSFFIKKAKRAGKKIVLHQHGGNFEAFYTEQDEKNKIRIQQILNLADVMLVLSPVLKDFFEKIMEPSRVILFPNAIEIPKAYEKEYGKKRILFLGRLCKEKGIEELLEIMPELHEKYPEMKLLLGGIWEEESLRKKAESFPEYVTYLGWIEGEAKRDYLSLSDIFVFPTYFEGQPVSVLEAMAFGCAVAASETGGIPQMIQHQENGLLFEPKNAEALKEALETLLGNEEICKKLGANARETVKKEFSIEDSIKKLVEIYHGIM